jgi:phosphoribosylamine--glycine ligase
MRILVLGGGGREHAIVTSLVASAHKPEVFCSPGNGGTAAIATNVSVPDTEPVRVVEWARDNVIDLVVIGPEAPLMIGMADVLAAEGIPVFGPRAVGAHLEGSKKFAKELMEQFSIPTGHYRTFEVEEDANVYLSKVGTPIVVKANGLAAGKGVTVAMTEADACAAVHESLSGQFGEAGKLVLIEEYLEGPECSLLAFTDGMTVLPMLTAQDHKRAFDGDEGPNTGGMGVYAPVPTVDDATLAQMVTILERTVAALRSEAITYRGVLYGGFVLTADGPKVLEYNARFGDPETQVLLPLLKTDLADVLLATAQGRLGEIELEWHDGSAVSVVLASGGYPGSYETGKPISGIAEASAIEGVTVYHAGTARTPDGVLVTAGGRVLNVTAVAPTFAEARDRAYRAVACITFEGMQHRTDIGLRALQASGGS